MNQNRTKEESDDGLVAKLADKESNIAMYELEKMSESLRGGGITPAELGIGVVRYWIGYVEALQRLSRTSQAFLLSLLREAESVLESRRRMAAKRLSRWEEEMRLAMSQAMRIARERRRE